MNPCLATELRAMKNLLIKPNFSQLSRDYNKDRHTIKKMFESLDSEPKARKKRDSALDPIRADIEALLSNKLVSIKAAYWCLQREKGVECTYSNFKQYVRKNGLRPDFPDEKPHPLYETKPGQLCQFDWVESLKMRLSTGDVIRD